VSGPGIAGLGPPRRDGLRVLTLNLWGRNGAWEVRRAVLLDGLRELRPDLVAFQEAVRVDGYDQTSDLLGPEFYVARQTVGLVGDGNHATIASRYPLGRVREVDLNVTGRTADFPCVALAAEVRAPEPVGPLLFVNHLPNFQLRFERERELQAVVVVRCVEELVGQHGPHVVLAGDFDATPDAASVRFLRGRQSLEGRSVCYRDAWESKHPGESGHTFSPRNPLVGSPGEPLEVEGEMAQELGRRIDYVMIRCGNHGPTLGVSSCELVFDQPTEGVWASDHFGVVADLAVPAVSS
jgi:endonuclease/exonuclease/phosphatase family metal-dependent hydrolase